MKKWTLGDLLSSLQVNSINAEKHGDVILVVMEEFGELPILITVGETQIVMKVDLYPVSSAKNQQLANETFLRMNDTLPMSNISIYNDANGEAIYAISGQMAVSTIIENIILELDILADNALELHDAVNDGFVAKQA
tara:strand:- start:3399 stop:3809 length:411 start_codon:yes stop_codon:yes gene_type:complete